MTYQFSLRDELCLLKRTQESFETIIKLQDQDAYLRNQLSDVWNNLLDLRASLLHKILTHDNMKIAGCVDNIKSIVKNL